MAEPLVSVDDSVTPAEADGVQQVASEKKKPVTLALRPNQIYVLTGKEVTVRRLRGDARIYRREKGMNWVRPILEGPRNVQRKGLDHTYQIQASPFGARIEISYQ